MKKQALSEIRSILQDLLQGPMEHIQQFLDPFMHSYTFFVETVDSIKRAWQLLIEGYCAYFCYGPVMPICKKSSP